MSETSGNRHRSLVRHGAGFVVSGLIAFSVDAFVLWAVTRYAGMDPFSGRVVAVCFAMIAAWLSHRRLTFNVTVPPTLAEFGRYATLAWTTAALNYAIYSGILMIWPQITPLAALVAATAVTMGYSYLGMRLAVFRNRG